MYFISRKTAFYHIYLLSFYKRFVSIDTLISINWLDVGLWDATVDGTSDGGPDNDVEGTFDSSNVIHDPDPKLGMEPGESDGASEMEFETTTDRNLVDFMEFEKKEPMVYHLD